MKNLQFLLDSQTDSKIFYWMRTFALIAVVMAHATFVHPDSQVLDRLLASFLDCGVAVFFFAAGAYWSWNPFSVTWKRIVRLLPSWILLGSLVYAVGAVKTGFSMSGWLLWLVGKNTYLWYLSIYVILQIAFYIQRMSKKRSLVLCISVMMVSRIATACLGLSGYQAFLNPLNWIGFFATGILFRMYANTVENKRKKIPVFIPIAAIVAIVAFAYLDTLMHTTRLDYWSYFDVFSKFAWIVLLFYLSRILVRIHGYEVGKASLPIYLLHIPVIGLVTNRLTVGVLPTMVVSVMVICVLYICLLFVKKIAAKCNLE